VSRRAKRVTKADVPANAFPIVSPQWRYKLLEQIGEGGFGLVFMAEQQVKHQGEAMLFGYLPGASKNRAFFSMEAADPTVRYEENAPPPFHQGASCIFPEGSLIGTQDSSLRLLTDDDAPIRTGARLRAGAAKATRSGRKAGHRRRIAGSCQAEMVNQSVITVAIKLVLCGATRTTSGTSSTSAAQASSRGRSESSPIFSAAATFRRCFRTLFLLRELLFQGSLPHCDKQGRRCGSSLKKNP
jgi:hypothetical protein